jgi:manganese/iron transport system permease protein
VLTVTAADIVTTAVTGVLLLLVLAAVHKELVLAAFDPGGAAAAGYRTGRLNALVLVVVSVALVTAVPAVGTLLAIALLTVPALAARLWTERVGPAMVVSAAIGAGSGVIGLCLSAAFDVAARGAIALTCTSAFAVSLLLRRHAA